MHEDPVPTRRPASDRIIRSQAHRPKPHKYRCGYGSQRTITTPDIRVECLSDHNRSRGTGATRVRQQPWRRRHRRVDSEGGHLLAGG